MTMGPGGGSDPGNSGRGGGSPGGNSGGGTGGGRDGRGNNTPGPRDGNGRGRTDNGATGGGPGRDTPGAPDAPDGKRGSTMGPDGGRATGGGRDGRGNNTPGSPASRARDAMARRERNTEQSQRREGMVAQEGLVSDEANLGIGEGYSHPDAIAERAKTGMVSPREADMARGYKAGKDSAMATQAVGGMIGDVTSRATSVPGIGKVAKTAVGAVAGSTVSTPETGYGAAVARNRASNTMAQSVAQTAAGMVGGPVAGYGAGMINTAINDQRTKDIDRMSDAMGFNTQGTQVTGSGNGNQVATTAAQQPAPPAPQTQNFAWNPVNMTNYNRGLLSLAQSS